MNQKKISERRYGNFEKGRIFGNYEVVSDPIDNKTWCSIVYECKCKKCGTTRRVEGGELSKGQQCRCNRRIDPTLIKQRRAEYKQAWFERNKERVYEGRRKQSYIEKRPKWSLRYLYHISEEEYEKLLKEQDGQCWICDRLHDDSLPRGKGKLRVDHDHDSYKIRGLLCHSCNVILGLCHEDKSVLSKMIEYIKRNEDEATIKHTNNQKS